MPTPKKTEPSRTSLFWAKTKEIFKAIVTRLFTRRFFANLLMISFILFTSIGAALLQGSGWGLITAGVTSGIFGFLLGLE